MMII
jgi:chromosome segregation ATPase